MESDAHGQPRNVALNWHRNLIKSVESLIGICTGLVADHVLNDQEIIFLDTWLDENEQIGHDWPANVIADRVSAILHDGVITQEESDDLRETLNSIIGDGIQIGIVDGMATRLPVVQIDSLAIDERVFCLTGKFIYGSRKKCESAIVERGGKVHPRVVAGLDYLVIGTLASRDWMHTGHGRKIEAAVKLQDQGNPVSIIAEEDWVKYL